MPRRKPHCAFCGERLTPKRRATLYSFLELPGKPTIGWHGLGNGECYEQDELSHGLCRMTPDALVAVLREIEARGPGRVVANKDWLRLVTSEQAEAESAGVSPTGSDRLPGEN